MTSIANDLANLLQDAGVGTVGTDIYYGKLPDQDDAPNNAIAVFEIGNIYTNNRWQRDELQIQFLSRGEKFSYESAYETSKSVKDALVGSPPLTKDGKTYALFSIISTGHVGIDDRDRHLFTLNLKVVVEGITGGHRLPL